LLSIPAVERAPIRGAASPCAFSSTPATSGSWLYQPAKKPATLYRLPVLFINAEHHAFPLARIAAAQ
jgi:hypothetical protein